MHKTNDATNNTLVDNLGIKILNNSNGEVTGKMPVDSRTIQPFGLLHGGASAAFAETLASIGGNSIIKKSNKAVVGIEINANHIKSINNGWVFGKATMLHSGKKTQVWDVHIVNSEDALICLSRVTLAIVNKK